MSDPSECCKGKVKFIMQMHGNFKESMVIPERPVDHFGGKISGTIRLEAPNGQIFDVGVAKKTNRTILQSGWGAFVDANQIQENYFLEFRYLGISCFKVTIFDSHGEARISCHAGTKNSTHVENQCTYCAEMSSGSQDGRSDSDGCCRKPGNMPAEKSPSFDELSAEGSASESESESVESDDLQGLSKDYVLSAQCHLTEEQEDKINALVAKIRSEIPLLVVMVKKSHVDYFLVISKDYARVYFPHKTQFVTVKLPGKSNAWSCKFYIRPDGRGYTLSLREFIRDNRVKEGDLCLFQPMKEVEFTSFSLMVHLLRKAGRTDIGSNHGEDSPSEYGSIQSDDQETSSEVPYILNGRCQLDEEDDVGIDALVAEIQPEIPLLVVKMTKSNVNGPQAALIISKGYAAAHFPTKSQTITLRLAGGKKKWHPHFHVRRGNIGYVLYGRWLEFVRDNHLREQDICLLQPIAKGEGRRFMVMVHLLSKARTTRRSKGASDYSNRSGYLVLGCSTCLTTAQETLVAEKVKAIQSPVPIYVATMDKSNLSSALDLSTTGHSAADRQLPDGKQTLTLRQAGWSKAWRVEMRHRRMIPAGGWREFTADNRLQAGDLCLLEPVKNERLAMAVHIIRSERYG